MACINREQEIYFDALTADAIKSANALESFRLSGVKRSMVEKYSDQAHFIYELLQNADDAKATSARFKLANDKLLFSHNGTRRFSVSDPATETEDQSKGTLGDINAITAVGGSNKIDQATIGKFGVGFKAVFQYTATPHIFDSNIFFKIEKFIVPIRLEDDYPGRRTDETLFVFPFDHDQRTAEEAYSDISEKLRSLDYPLLFLSNLKEISFEISGQLGLYGKSIEEKKNFNNITAEFIRLTQDDGNDCEDLYEDLLWLFSREDGMGHKYSVGFFVDPNGHLIPKAHTAFCFFPTKEVTGLNFVIHAPFLLTDSREGIRAGVEHNLDMVSLMSKLAADSLVCLKEIGLTKKVLLIDDNIFDIVPYDETKFGDVDSKKTISFKPFYLAMKDFFNTEDIIPCLGGYVTAKNAYWASVPQIAELFSNEQLAFLAKNDSAKWVFASFGRQDTSKKNKALTNYIDSITAVWLNEKDLLSGWSIENGPSYKGVTAEFIESQPIEWLHRFYKWISETKARTELVLSKPIFLDQDRKAVSAYDDEKQAMLFLPTEDGNGYLTVNEELLQNEETLAFVKQIGIREPSLQNEISIFILAQYKNGVPSDTKPHFKKFFRYYLTCSQTEVKSFLALIKEYEFILCTSHAKQTHCFGKSSEIYFPLGPLEQWFQMKPETKFVCFDEYLEIVGEENKEELINFFTELGVSEVPRTLTRKLTSEEALDLESSWPQSTRPPSWTEKSIDGCKEFIGAVVEKQNADLSKFLWSQLLCFVHLKYLENNQYSWQINASYGKYEYFYHRLQSKPFQSSELMRLRTQPWLMNNSGKFVSASELTVETLHAQYDKSSDEALELLSLLEIYEEDEETTDKNVEITRLAVRLGLSEEEQREALLEYAKNKQVAEKAKTASSNIDEDLLENESDDGTTEGVSAIDPSVKRVVNEISRRASENPKERTPIQTETLYDDHTDEDYYSKPTLDISKKIEKVKEQAEREINEIAQLEDLIKLVQDTDKYSYGWFKALLELESLNSCENNFHSREISISFAKVEHEAETSRILILKHPSRYIPQSMENLSDIPLELHFADQPMVKVAIEVVNVKSYSLRAKLRTNAQIEGIDLSKVTEARIEAKNPVFLIDELRKSFIKLGEENGYSDNFNMQESLCENIEFVFGPPGTGKTTYVSRELILPMMRSEEDLKVLVLTPTNKSADVLVRALFESMGTDQNYLNWLVRFGTTNDNAIEQSGVFRDKTFDIRTLSRYVAVTTIARFPYDYFMPEDGTRLHLKGMRWDFIIIDEASMIPLANIIYPLYKKTPLKFIIAGDPFQIEPITTVDEWKNENIYTMVRLDSFTDPMTFPHSYHVKLLTTQFRSIPEIGEIFSRFAYGGVLKHFRTSGSKRDLPINDYLDVKPLNIIKFPVSKFESIYRPKRLQSKTPYQIYSALFAFEFVKYLSSLIGTVKGDEELRIGLIAPYRAQADLVDKLMSSAALPQGINVQVGTIHGFQGDECDIVIALFNPPPSISTHKDMFLNKLNIVNVSISRARDYLFILMPDDNTENVGNLSLIKKVERLCKGQPMWSEQQSTVIEELMFGSKTFLEDNSFSTSHQLVNVYSKPEKRYEVRSEENAVDIQIHE